MRKWLKHTKNEKGLTLVELLAVVVILGIIAAIAVPSIGGIIENSKKDAAISNAQQVLSAARLYAASGGETDSEDGYSVDGDISEYHEDIVDPWTNKEEDVNYTVTFEDNLVPSIEMSFSECAISSRTAKELSEDGRAACEDIE